MVIAVILVRTDCGRGGGCYRFLKTCKTSWALHLCFIFGCVCLSLAAELLHDLKDSLYPLIRTFVVENAAINCMFGVRLLFSPCAKNSSGDIAVERKMRNSL